MDLETQLLECPLLRSNVDEIGVASGQVLLEPPVLDIPEEPKSIAEERSSGLDGCIVGVDIAETRLAVRAETVFSGTRGRPALVLVVVRGVEAPRVSSRLGGDVEDRALEVSELGGSAARRDLDLPDRIGAEKRRERAVPGVGLVEPVDEEEVLVRPRAEGGDVVPAPIRWPGGRGAGG